MNCSDEKLVKCACDKCYCVVKASTAHKDEKGLLYCSENCAKASCKDTGCCDAYTSCCK